MSVEIKKPIDRTYLLKQLELLAGYELYELHKNEKVIDIPENYTKCESSDPGAILVDSTNILTIVTFISDIQIGDYVIHTPETSHYEDVVYEKYARRQGDDKDPSDLWDGSEETIDPNRKFIRDDEISSLFNWSSEKINDEIADAVKDLGTMSFEVVTELPSEPSKNIFYVLDDSTKTFPIYIYSETKGWVNTGAKLDSVDLSGYAKTDDVVAKAQGSTNAGKVLTVGTDGNVEVDEIPTISDMTASTVTDTDIPTVKAVKDYFERIIPTYTKSYYDAHKDEIPNGTYFVITDDN